MKIKELYEKIRDGVIISDIELQREIIYNTEKQQLVIDSILNDVPLPAFYQVNLMRTEYINICVIIFMKNIHL